MSEFEAEEGVAQESAQKEGIEKSEVVFDPWLKAFHKLPEMMAGNIVSTYLRAAGPRQREMKADVRANLQAIVAAIVTNLAYAVAAGHEPPSVAISLRSASRVRTRYDRREFSMLPKVVAAIHDLGSEGSIFSLEKSYLRGASSRITAGPLLADMVRRVGPFLDAYYREPGIELIRLSRTSLDHYENRKAYEWIDYEDTMETHHFRMQVDTINARLGSASLDMVDDGGPKVPLRQRELVRYFKLLPEDDAPRFDRGGRLFGGWWQVLPKARRGAIRINGEPIADLDFANMFLRLAYLRAGHEPPSGDLYAMVPGFEDRRWRTGVKLTANAMLFRIGPLKRLPKVEGIREMLPPGTRGPHLRAAILAGHPKLGGIFETGMGYDLMFQESQILVDALHRLAEQGVPALPMHDGCMVQISASELTRLVMQDVAERRVGFPLPVELKAATA